MKMIPCLPLQTLRICCGLLATAMSAGALQMANSNTGMTNRSVFAELSRNALGRFVNSLTPIEVQVPTGRPGTAGKIVIEDVKYCKASTSHSAILLRYGSLSSTATAPARTIVTDSQRFTFRDCTVAISAVRDRLAGGRAAVVANLSIISHPWKLTIKVKRMAAGPSTHISPRNAPPP